jgi:hypothetical protein
MYFGPVFNNVYAVGIAFAPTHPISKGKKTGSGLAVVATPPRTGIASGIMGRAVAENIAMQVDGKMPDHHARTSETPAACIASMGKSLWTGSAATIIMTPVARSCGNFKRNRAGSSSRSKAIMGLFWRRFLPLQIWRFVTLNFKTYRIARGSAGPSRRPH